MAVSLTHLIVGENIMAWFNSLSAQRIFWPLGSLVDLGANLVYSSILRSFPKTTSVAVPPKCKGKSISSKQSAKTLPCAEFNFGIVTVSGKSDCILLLYSLSLILSHPSVR